MTRTAQEGFTLLELTWVLFILAILLSVVMPHFSAFLFQMGLEKKAREIFTALTYTQQQALNQNCSFGLFFDLTEGSQEVTCYLQKGYDAQGAPVVDPNNVLLNPLLKKPYITRMNQEGLTSDSRITEADFGGNPWVEFNSMGEPNHEGRITLAGADSSYTITVSRIGRVAFTGD
ncbi:MAG: GspH/FimT family pseudopilin [bacterium]